MTEDWHGKAKGSLSDIFELTGYRFYLRGCDPQTAAYINRHRETDEPTTQHAQHGADCQVLVEPRP
jgi:hypothetical protein